MTPARPPVDLPAQRLAVVRGLARALDLASPDTLTPREIRARLVALGPSLTGARQEAARALWEACSLGPDGALTEDCWGQVNRGHEALEET